MRELNNKLKDRAGGDANVNLPTRRIHRNQPLTPIPRIRSPKLLNHCMIRVGVMIMRASMKQRFRQTTPQRKNCESAPSSRCTCVDLERSLSSSYGRIFKLPD
jgi:hypothetical protein